MSDIDKRMLEISMEMPPDEIVALAKASANTHLENLQLKTKLMQLEKCVINFCYEETGDSYDEAKAYIEDVYTGKYDKEFDEAIESSKQ